MNKIISKKVLLFGAWYFKRRLKGKKYGKMLADVVCHFVIVVFKIITFVCLYGFGVCCYRVAM